MTRWHQIVLVGSTLLGSWLGMQAIHELGHVIGAWVTGGAVERVILHPLTISQTILSHNPHPLVVVWCGPVAGVALALLLWAGAVVAGLPSAALRFFAGFCLLANGMYISVGALWKIGDPGDMLRHGAHAWQLGLFGILTVPAGLWLWHGQGHHFGLGNARGKVHRGQTYATLIACVLLILLGLAVGK